MWALRSLYVFVCAGVRVCVCVCVCLSVDSGALMLKDVSSFLHCTGLLWQPCWAALMSRVCHCRTFSSETTVRGDQNGMFILSITPPPLSSLSLFTSLSLSSCRSPFHPLLALGSYALETLTYIFTVLLYFSSPVIMILLLRKMLMLEKHLFFLLWRNWKLLSHLKVWQCYQSTTSFFLLCLSLCMLLLDWHSC